MILRFLTCKRRALSSTQRPFVHSSLHFNWGNWTLAHGRPCCLHSSSSTTNMCLSDVSSGGSEFSEEEADASCFCENPNTPDTNESSEVQKLGKTMQSGCKTKAIGDTSRGIFKAILIGEAGHAPYQKMIKSGAVTLFSLGTSGMRNNRKPYENETPDQYARRSFVQWHRIAIYQDQLGALAMESVKKGSQVYVEGNLETRVFLEPETNSIKRIQEIAGASFSWIRTKLKSDCSLMLQLRFGDTSTECGDQLMAQ